MPAHAPLPSAAAARPYRPAGYFQRSQQPFQSLIFLLPLILAYEVGTFVLHRMAQARGEPAMTIKAYSLLNHFFELLGVTGYYLPGIIVIVVLLCWHLARKPSREDWRISPPLYGLMAVECVLLALPLLVWGLVFFRETASATAPPAMMALMSGASPSADLGQQIILSIGAGIYEELLFRLIAIALLHMVFVDLLALPQSWGAAGAVTISAMAFGLYHFTNLNVHEWTGYDWTRCFFYACAGVFLAMVYVMRGFGIVAGTHAVYDILMALLQFLARS